MSLKRSTTPGIKWKIGVILESFFEKVLTFGVENLDAKDFGGKVSR